MYPAAANAPSIAGERPNGKNPTACASADRPAGSVVANATASAGSMGCAESSAAAPAGPSPCGSAAVLPPRCSPDRPPRRPRRRAVASVGRSAGGLVVAAGQGACSAPVGGEVGDSTRAPTEALVLERLFPRRRRPREGREGAFGSVKVTVSSATNRSGIVHLYRTGRLWRDGSSARGRPCPRGRSAATANRKLASLSSRRAGNRGKSCVRLKPP